MQKFPAESFTATARLAFNHINDSEEVGLIIMGLDYAYLSLKQDQGQLYLKMATCRDTEKNNEEKETARAALTTGEVFLRVKVEPGAQCTFSYSTDGEVFRDIGEAFKAREGKWIGAKVGFFSIRDKQENNGGYTDIDWFRIAK